MSKKTQESEKLARLSELNLSACVPACDISQLDASLVDRILLAQKMAGLQFVATSGFRSKEYELSKHRKGTSSHCKGLALDVSARDSFTRFKILVAAVLTGIPRIGVGKTFLHLDIDESKAHPIIFHYYDPQET